MYESSGSQFFRTKTRIQSGPEYLQESRSFMAFLIIPRVRYTMQFQISSKREKNYRKRFQQTN